MNVITKDLEISASKPVTFVPLSDLHIGHVDCDMQYLQNTVNWIKKKKAVTVLIGDMIDAIGIRDKRFEVNSLDPFFLPYLDQLYQKQVDVLLDILRPIKDQILWIMTGNHETTIKKRASFDAIAQIASALEISILTDPGYSVLRFQMSTAICTLKIWASHGCFLGGRLRGNKINRLEQVSQYFPGCDLYLAGHTHDKWITEGHQVRLTNNYVLTKKKTTIRGLLGVFLLLKFRAAFDSIFI
jgi:predicted MPP superfamily phosphohydrolase